jgi:hypothetical protein
MVAAMIWLAVRLAGTRLRQRGRHLVGAGWTNEVDWARFDVARPDSAR